MTLNTAGGSLITESEQESEILCWALNMAGGATEYGNCPETGKREDPLLWPKPSRTGGTE